MLCIKEPELPENIDRSFGVFTSVFIGVVSFLACPLCFFVGKVREESLNLLFADLGGMSILAKLCAQELNVLVVFERICLFSVVRVAFLADFFP